MFPSLKLLILLNTLLKTILFLDELSQNRNKAEKCVPILEKLGISVEGGCL
jgi:hypothetical protein